MLFGFLVNFTSCKLKATKICFIHKLNRLLSKTDTKTVYVVLNSNGRKGFRRRSHLKIFVYIFILICVCVGAILLHFGRGYPYDVINNLRKRERPW